MTGFRKDTGNILIKKFNYSLVFLSSEQFNQSFLFSYLRQEQRIDFVYAAVQVSEAFTSGMQRRNSSVSVYLLLKI
jgi:hypothetical protein